MFTNFTIMYFIRIKYRYMKFVYQSQSTKAILNTPMQLCKAHKTYMITNVDYNAF